MCAAVFCSSAPAFAAPIAKGPYLQELRKDSVEVRVELEAPGAATLEVSRGGEPARTIVAPAPKTFHVFRVDKLEPQTRYEYAVKVDGAPGANGTFTTAPKDDSTAPFKFLVYGDNRSDNAAHAAVVRALLGSPSDFLLHTGDFVQAGNDPADWQAFFSIERQLLRDRATFAAIGNHELFQDPGGTGFLRFFGPAAAGSAKLYGSFRWGNTRFFMLNTFPVWDNGEERQWLEKELALADAEPGLRWRIAVVHHGPYSAGHHGPNVPFVQGGVPELLVAHHVDLVVSGHDHMYERGESSSPGTGLRYIVSGGGGAPLYRNLRATAYTRKIEATFHFVGVEVSSEIVRIAATRADGSLVERCAFTHKPGWDCDAAPTGASSAAATAPAAASGRPGPANANANAHATPPSRADSSRCSCSVPGASSERLTDVEALASLGVAALLIGARPRAPRDGCVRGVSRRSAAKRESS